MSSLPGQKEAGAGRPELDDQIERALQLAEDTLRQIAEVTIAGIRAGVSSNHVEAAEAKQREVMRMLVRAKDARSLPLATRINERDGSEALAGDRV